MTLDEGVDVEEAARSWALETANSTEEVLVAFPAALTRLNVDEAVIYFGPNFIQHNPEELGLAIVEIFRLEHGKIVEHWDVRQQMVG